MRDRIRFGIAAAVALVLLAGAGAAYVVTTAHHSHEAERAASTAPRTMPLLDVGDASMPTPTQVSSVLRRALERTAFGHSLAGVVVDAATGTQLFARQPARAVPPASTLKLFTAAAALTALRADDTLQTGVVRSGGTLYLVGGGDVTLTAKSRPGYPPTATFVRLAARTATALHGAAPVRLRYDAGGWSGPTLAPGWSSGYLAAGDVSRVSPLELDEARLTNGPTAPRAADPAGQAAEAFRRALTAAGVRVVGAVRPAEAPSSGLGIAAVSSPTIAALVQRMLTSSDNDLAEALGRTVALQLGRPATFAGAAGAVRTAVADLGVPMGGAHLYDASGLSRLDRVTPDALVTLLRIAQHDVRLGPLVAGLPVAGFTGTLADRYRNGSVHLGAGVVRAKTGTLAGINALAGQALDADGRLLLFAFVVDNVPTPSAGESVLDRLAASLAGT